MINSRDKWELELDINEDFSIRIRDGRTCVINGTFDRNQIADEIIYYYTPGQLYNEERLEEWAEENGYIKQEEE